MSKKSKIEIKISDGNSWFDKALERIEKGKTPFKKDK